MPGSLQIVTGPIALPPTDGLRGARGAAVVENPADAIDTRGDWTKGYTFDFDLCDAGRVYAPCDPGTLDLDRGYGGRRNIEPFAVQVGRRCSTFGWQAQDYVADATRLLDAYQYGLIARELWTGGLAIDQGWVSPEPDEIGNPFLAWHLDPQFVDLIAENGGDPLVDTVDPVQALAELEQGLATCSSGPGVIHASKRIATLWANANLLVREGGRLFTILGTQVVSDRGYDGSGPTMDGPDPDGPILPGFPATADREWAYATGALTIRIETGPARLTPGANDLAAAVDRGQNDVVYYAERKASVSWGCCHLAIAIDTGWSLIPVPDDGSS